MVLCCWGISISLVQNPSESPARRLVRQLVHGGREALVYLAMLGSVGVPLLGLESSPRSLPRTVAAFLLESSAVVLQIAR